MFRFAVSALLLCAALGQLAQAYTFNPVFSGRKFAINEVILDAGEDLDDHLARQIAGEIRGDNKTRGLFQSTTAVFPSGAPGLKSGIKINAKILGVFDVRTYSDSDIKASFYSRQFATEVGIYLNFSSLRTIIDNKSTFFLLEDLRAANLPVIILEMPVAMKGYDIKNSFFITGRSPAVLIDLMVLDSVYYSRDDYLAVGDNCRVNFMGIIDRMQEDVPVFLNMHGAINKIICDAAAPAASGSAAGRTPPLRPAAAAAPQPAPAAPPQRRREPDTSSTEFDDNTLESLFN